MHVTIAIARDLLQYNNVVERHNLLSVSADTSVVYSAIPENTSQPPVDIYFNEDRSVIDIVSFCTWHTHFEGGDYEEANLLNGFAAANSLVHRRTCLVQEVDSIGNDLGASIVELRDMPVTLAKNCKRLRRWIFGKPPEYEVIDFANYYAGKRVWIELNRKKYLESQYTDCGLSPPEW